MNIESTRQKLQEERQEHVLKFWSELNPKQRAQLVTDLENVDWDMVRSETARVGETTAKISADELAPPSVFHAESGDSALYQEARLRGVELIQQNKVAALTVAGGQGTRLGFDGPKGCFPITPVRNKTLFQHFAEGILATNRRYGSSINWHIMTSPDNHQATVDFFRSRQYFGLDQSAVHFFQQRTVPAISTKGKVLLSEKHRLALSPDGHGGTLRALDHSGLLQKMRSEGVLYVSYFQIDNPLVHPVDPLFIGLVDLEKAQVGSKTIAKAYEGERVGVLVERDNKQMVIEYSDFPPELSRMRDEKDGLKYNCANMAVHVFSTEFICQITSGDGVHDLPWHHALKKVSHIDIETGKKIEPTEPNAIKLERFIFDALPLATQSVILQVRREEEFSPVKNAEGVDSPLTARTHLHERCLRWLSLCGVDVARLQSQPVEISPLYALDAEDLKSKVDTPSSLSSSEPIYLGP